VYQQIQPKIPRVYPCSSLTMLKSSMMVDEDVTTETSGLDDILHMARCVKEGNKIHQQYEDHYKAGMTSNSHVTHVAQSSHPTALTM